MNYLTTGNVELLLAKLGTLMPEIIRSAEQPTCRSFSGIDTKLTLAKINNGVLVDNGVEELGTVSRNDTIQYLALCDLIENGVNAEDFDTAIDSNEFGTWLPKLTFKRRLGFAVWSAIEELAAGVHANDTAHEDYVAPDAFAKYWLEIYADQGLEHVCLTDPETIGTLDYLISKGKLTAEAKAAILAV